jgi:hypothetical protein
VEYRAIEILEDVLGSWCQTLSVLRANLDQSLPGTMAVWHEPPRKPADYSDEMTSTMGQSAGRPRI